MILLLSVGLTVSCSKEDSSELTAINAKSQKGMDQGNGAPSGAHYNLNIIGVSKDKTADMTGNNGGRIFVSIDGRSKIMLTEGDDFQVLDANATDGSAEFMLPNPDPDGNGWTSYSVWIRPLGPGGSATISLCADADKSTDPSTGLDGYYEVCTAEPLTVTRTKGSKPRFEEVTRELLTIYVEEDINFVNAAGEDVTVKAGRYTIFDDTFEDYFWYYDNDGLKILQLRFYEISVDIS